MRLIDFGPAFFNCLVGAGRGLAFRTRRSGTRRPPIVVGRDHDPVSNSVDGSDVSVGRHAQALGSVKTKRIDSDKLDSHWNVLDRDVQALMAQVDQGCRKSFAQLYDRTSPQVMGMVFTIVTERRDAESVVTALYCKVWFERTSVAKAEPRGMSWLIAMTRDAAIASVAERSREMSLSLAPDPDPKSHRFAANRPRVELPQHGPRLPLLSLSDSRRRAIALAVLKGFGFAEVAVALGCDVRMTKQCIRLAFEDLRDAESSGCLSIASAPTRCASSDR